MDRNGESFSASEEITVHARVNRVVSNFAIATEITPGQDNIISATVQNIGEHALETNGVLHVGYFLSTDEQITVDDILTR